MSESDGTKRRETAERGGQDEGPADVPNRLEQVVSGVSLLLLLAAIGYLVWEGVRPTDPPAFEAVVREVHASGSDHHVRFEVRNTGGESVQDLAVRVEATDGEATVAEAETSLSWLPSGSMRQAAVVLPVDPSEHVLEFVFVGYELP